MTGKTVVLPIKCSTLKKVSDKVENILETVVVIYGITSVLFTATVRNLSPTPINMALVIFSIFGILVFFATSVFACIWIVGNIPRIECIKDDDVK